MCGGGRGGGGKEKTVSYRKEEISQIYGSFVPSSFTIWRGTVCTHIKYNMNNIRISSNEWWRRWWWWHFCIKFIWIIQNCNWEIYKMEYGENEAVMGFGIEFDRHKSTWQSSRRLYKINFSAYTHLLEHTNLSIGFNKRFNINSSGTMWRILIHSRLRVECFQKIHQSEERERKKCKHTLTLTVFIMLCLRKCKTEKCFVVLKTMPTVTFHHRHAQHPFQAFFYSFSAPHFFILHIFWLSFHSILWFLA